MRVAYITTPPYSGSRYKYAQMFSRLCDMEQGDIEDLSGFDAAIVHGDCCDHYRRPLEQGVPYICVEQDLYSMRKGLDTTAQEREMLQNAASILFTADPHVAYCEERYRLPEVREIIHLRPLAADLDFEPLPKLEGKHIVYAGGIVPKSARNSIFGYRAYHDIFRELIRAGWTVHVYPAWTPEPKRIRDMQKIGCVTHDQVPQDELYRELSQYTLGFHGYALTGPQEYTQTCRPNKCWEFQAAGIPMVSFNPGTCRDVFEGKWGLVADSLNDLPSVAERAALIEIDEQTRRAEVIDNDLDKFARLLEAVC